MSESDSPALTQTPADSEKIASPYGAILAQARKTRNLSVEEVAEQLNITQELILKLETSATVGLPPPAFTQGYLRAYARLMEVPVDKVLHDFALAVPHSLEADLDVRHRLPKQATRHSPAVKSATGVLMLLAVVILGYGFYGYYSERATELSVSESSSASGGSPARVEQEPGLALTIGQQAADDELQLTDEAVGNADVLSEEGILEDSPPESPEPEPVEPDDISVFAEEDSWVEITDSAGTQIHYNLLKQGAERDLQGVAPFDVFLGNAPGVEISVNSSEVDFSGFIRANNVARFRISIRDDEPVSLRR